MVYNSSRRVGGGFPVPILLYDREAKRLPYSSMGEFSNAYLLVSQLLE